MLKNAVIIIPKISDEEQVCDFLWQTKNILEKDNEVFVVDYFKVINLLPLRRFKTINQLNKSIYFFLLQIYISIKFYKRGRKYYFWMFFPQLIDAIKLKLPWWQVIFDLVDYHDSPIPAEQKILHKQKKYLLSKADYIFSISHSLKELYQKDAKAKIEIVPQGFDLTNFAENRKKSTIDLPTDRPLVGFVGQISQRLDFNLLLDLVRSNQQWNFIFVGPKHHESNVASTLMEEKIKQLFKQKNVFYFGKQNRQELLDIIKHFAVCIIPYDAKYDFNRYSYPMKIFEYFFAGKPVVSTEIVELKRFDGFIKIAKEAEDFGKAINSFLKKPLVDDERNQQLILAQNNTWESKISKISKYLMASK